MITDPESIASFGSEAGKITVSSRAGSLICKRMLLYCASAFGVMLAAALISGEPLMLTSGRDLVLMLALGLGVQSLGWFLVARAQEHLDAGTVGLILLLEPVIAFGANGLLGFGHPTLAQAVAAIVAVACIYVGVRIKIAAPA